MKHARLLALLFVTTLLFSFSCADLNVDNMNEPDSERVYFTEESVAELSNDLFRRWYVTVHSYRGPQMALAVSADAATASLGNSGMEWANTEPREGWDNSIDYQYAYVTEDIFTSLYEINADASFIIKTIHDRNLFQKTEEAPKYVAQAKLIQGLSIGYIALLFDKAHFVDENSTVNELTHPELLTYSELMSQAIIKLEEVISITETSTFALDENYISTNTLTDNVFLNQLANSFITRFLVQNPRTEEETLLIDWEKVTEHGLASLPSGLIIYNDQWTDGAWYNEGYNYLVYPGWGKVDMRIIHIMDNSYPDRNPGVLNFDEPDSATIFNTESIDNRLWLDYEYGRNPCGFRGCDLPNMYMRSNWRYTKYDHSIIETESGLLPEISKSELGMLLAESYLHRNMYGEAAAIINNSERISRGGLPTVNAGNPDEIWDAIHQEVMVEQYLTGMGNEFFFMRRYNLLQEGTITQFPIPAAVLKLMGEEEPYYTFGGEENADGINTSNGGWR